MTVQALADLRQQQAASLAYFDVFWLCAALGVVLVFLVLLMKRSVAEKGAHVGGGVDWATGSPALSAPFPFFLNWRSVPGRWFPLCGLFRICRRRSVCAKP